MHTNIHKCIQIYINAYVYFVNTYVYFVNTDKKKKLTRLRWEAQRGSENQVAI